MNLGLLLGLLGFACLISPSVAQNCTQVSASCQNPDSCCGGFVNTTAGYQYYAMSYCLPQSYKCCGCNVGNASQPFDANVFCFGCPTGELCVSSNATMGLKFYCEKAKSSAGSMNINIFTALAAAIVVALGLKFHQRS